MALVRYHIFIDEIRTTVSLTPVLSELLTLRLGAEPRTKDAHARVRAWLQGEIDRDPGAVRYGGASQRLAHLAVLRIADAALVNKRDQWLDALDTKVSKKVQPE